MHPRIRAGSWAALVGFGCAGSASPPAVEASEERARDWSVRATQAETRGDLAQALALATRALVARLAECGFGCPEPAYSFVQLGDLRRKNGQHAWAAQSYHRALTILRAHEGQEDWIRATEQRLALVCERLKSPVCGE